MYLGSIFTIQTFCWPINLRYLGKIGATGQYEADQNNNKHAEYNKTFSQILGYFPF